MKIVRQEGSRQSGNPHTKPGAGRRLGIGGPLISQGLVGRLGGGGGTRQVVRGFGVDGLQGES